MDSVCVGVCTKEYSEPFTRDNIQNVFTRYKRSWYGRESTSQRSKEAATAAEGGWVGVRRSRSASKFANAKESFGIVKYSLQI